MNNEQNKNTVTTIHDFDFDLICDFFLGLDRQGPGSPEMTLRALSFVEGLNVGSHIVDLGCGTGGQTMTLAAATPGRITGLDLFPNFIEKFNEQAWDHGVRGRVRGIVGSMDDLPFERRSLDLIWCEGAIYNIGFERGLRYWRQFLKSGGYVAVTENTYFTDERPAPIEAFWNAAYPEIDTIPAKITAMRRAGYEFVAAFALPETCWTENYYDRLPAAQEAFLEKHAGNKAAEAFIASEREERALFDHTHFGYVFYIAQKPNGR
jgi:ubiquinone/menaquinone biosynthesis C-methylase UbiE